MINHVNHLAPDCGLEARRIPVFVGRFKGRYAYKESRRIKNLSAAVSMVDIGIIIWEFLKV